MTSLQQVYDLAVQHHQAGRLAEAEGLYRQILSQQPNHADAVHLLGILAGRTGRAQEALELLRRAIALNPSAAPYRASLGTMFARLGQHDDAIVAYRAAIGISPAMPDAWIALGNSLQAKLQFDQAIAAYHHAASLNPDSAEACFSLGVAFNRKGQLDDAIEAYHRAIKLRPNYLEAYSNLGASLRMAGRLDEAIAAYRQALSIEPRLPQIWSNLGNVLRDSGLIDEAIDCFRQAEPFSPDARGASNLLYALYFHPDYDAGKIYDEHVRWNRTYAQPLESAIRPHDNERSPDRRLRIGYVSPDFCEHCQSLFTEPLLSNHDRSQFEVFCYSDVIFPDLVTRRLSGYADQWRPIAGMGDQQVADLIRQDRIDVLVDLTLHMANNRMMVFARKPAPVQVTWLGYPGTTGLRTMDYRLSDPHLDPAGLDDAFYFEKTIRLPQTFWCYDPHSELPVSDLPAKSNGHITFGCLNNFAKVNDGTLDIWSRILSAVPGSKLLLLAPTGSARERVLARLEQNGIAVDRIEFVDRQPRSAYLGAYNRIDIGLETFPCNGHTTSIDAAWMGVSVPTMPGATAISRGGTSILSNLGLQDLIARSADEYVRIVSELAMDIPRLANLRATLRPRLAASPLMNGPQFTREIEKTFRDMWKTYCLTSRPGTGPSPD